MPAWLELREVKLRPVPILLTAVLGLGLGLAGALIAARVSPHLPAAWAPYLPWVRLYIGHGVQLILTLGVIALMRRSIPGDYGLRLPQGRSYVRPAIVGGVAFGLLMTLVDFGPALVAHVAPEGPYSLDPVNVAGWLSFEGLFVGFPEEILFRGLLVTYLTARIPGRIRAGRFEMNAAGVLVALLFALLHSANFASRPFLVAAGQQLYALALGVLYAYWFEKSRSLLAPVIAHNLSDLVEYGLTFGLVALWG